MESLETFIQPLVAEWWNRFCRKHELAYLSNNTVDFGTVYQFFSLQCGLTRLQTKQLAKLLQSQGVLRIQRNGWRILKLQMQEAVVVK